MLHELPAYLPAAFIELVASLSTLLALNYFSAYSADPLSLDWED